MSGERGERREERGERLKEIGERRDEGEERGERRVGKEEKPGYKGASSGSMRVLGRNGLS
jgi:hypothetical protein